MRIVWTLVAYVVALGLIAAVAVVAILVLAGPHSDLLPAPLQSVVVGLGWLSVLALPIVVARRVWRRTSGPTPAEPPAPPARDVATLTAGLAAPAAQLVRTDGATRSHLGGSPNLPDGRPWPEWRGRPLDFLARLSLAELQAATPIGWLPTTGALLFFYDAENQPWGFDPADRGSCAVLHVADDALPASMPKELQSLQLFERTPIAFRPVATLPSQERAPAADLELSDAESDAYEDLRDAVYEGEPRHQVGGFPFPVQSDGMELECQLASNGLYCGDSTGYRDARAQALAPGARDWRLLLQFDTDDGAGVMWGDCGTLYVWVREQDAAQGRLDDAWLILQCS